MFIRVQQQMMPEKFRGFLLLQVSLRPERLDLEAVSRRTAEDSGGRGNPGQLAERLHHFRRRSHLLTRARETISLQRRIYNGFIPKSFKQVKYIFLASFLWMILPFMD